MQRIGKHPGIIKGSTLSRKIEKDRVSKTSTQSSLKAEIDEIKASIDNNDKAIANLVNSLSEGQDPR